MWMWLTASNFPHSNIVALHLSHVWAMIISLCYDDILKYKIGTVPTNNVDKHPYRMKRKHL